MILLLAAYAGGVLTIVSPCILPVLPFAFARADRPFLRSGLPLLAGMAFAFTVIGTLAAVAGGWAVELNRYGRYAALAVFALFGLLLLLPALADRVMQPLANAGGRLVQSIDARSDGEPGMMSSVLLGVATGLLWAPCAGPILGLILAGAALQGASASSTLLLLAYALGAATSLAIALLAGGKVFASMKRSLAASVWMRRALGAAVLVSVAGIAAGLDTGLLARLSTASTTRLEQSLLDRLHPESSSATAGAPAMSGSNSMMMSAASVRAGAALAVEDLKPSLTGATGWLNSQPLSIEALKGKVVLIDFWTYSCVNCLRATPYVRAWAGKYASQGLVVIGVHTPEFAFEKLPGNVQRAVADLQIGYPVALDNDYAVWRAFSNRFWPAHYFLDVNGRIRHHHFGEGGYDESERVIQQLLAEGGQKGVAPGLVEVHATGAQAASDAASVLSPETYLGYERAENFVSPGGAVKDARHVYVDGEPRLNEWGLTGEWTVARENVMLQQAGGGIVYRFHARDLHLVLGPAADGKPLRFRVTIDGKAPGKDHGVDADAQGNGVIDGQRLYQLIRQQGPVEDRRFEIRFLDSGAQAYAFTFG